MIITCHSWRDTSMGVPLKNQPYSKKLFYKSSVSGSCFLSCAFTRNESPLSLFPVQRSHSAQYTLTQIRSMWESSGDLPKSAGTGPAKIQPQGLPDNESDAIITHWELSLFSLPLTHIAHTAGVIHHVRELNIHLCIPFILYKSIQKSQIQTDDS